MRRVSPGAGSALLALVLMTVVTGCAPRYESAGGHEYQPGHQAPPPSPPPATYSSQCLTKGITVTARTGQQPDALCVVTVTGATLEVRADSAWSSPVSTDPQVMTCTTSRSVSETDAMCTAVNPGSAVVQLALGTLDSAFEWRLPVRVTTSTG